MMLQPGRLLSKSEWRSRGADSDACESRIELEYPVFRDYANTRGRGATAMEWRWMVPSVLRFTLYFPFCPSNECRKQGDEKPAENVSESVDVDSLEVSS
jgi:hypothetical protein